MSGSDEVSQQKLSEADIRNHLESADQLVVETLMRLNSLVAESAGQDGSTQVFEISVDTLRRTRQTIAFLYKTVNDAAGVRSAADRGDQAATATTTPSAA